VRILVSRFLAYCAAGIFLGPAVWIGLVHDQFPTADLTLIIAGGLGVFGFGLAVFLLRKAGGNSGKGIAVTPKSSAVAVDIICVVAAGMAGFFIVDGYAGSFGLELLATDPLLADVIAFMFLPATLFVALFVSGMTSQKISVDSRGITLSGFTGTRHVVWDDIQSIEPDEQFVVVSRVGMPVPRHLRTNLQVTTRDGENLTLFEPATDRTKTRILSALWDLAPDRLKDQLAPIGEAWGTNEFA
jgi:hypothetical protein